jgi:hypothetical protein
MSRASRILLWPTKYITFGRVFKSMSLVSLLFLSCVCGAAIVFFNILPASQYFKKAFMGFDAWIQHGSTETPTHKEGVGRSGLDKDDPTKTFDGFTLYTSTQGSNATLLDMQGNKAHQWKRPFSEVWPNPTHVKHKVSDELIHWFRARALPNGDLLAIYQTDADTPHGYGLAKLDKDSNVIWAFADNVHHDLDVGDDGKIYALTHRISTDRLENLVQINPPYLVDSVVILSPDGKELEKISILDAFQNSPYALLLSLANTSTTKVMNRAQVAGAIHSPPSGVADPIAPNAHIPANLLETGDLLHANSVKVLKRAMAPRFPQFKEGQLLISLCALQTVAVLDLPSKSIVWAVNGAWSVQHDAEFLPTGNLLLYDNLGLKFNTRVLEFDPKSLSYPWYYANEHSAPFSAVHRGMKQALPNGNVLIVDPDGGRLFEVTRGKEPVWELVCPALGRPDMHPILTGAWRYAPAELPFLAGVAVRPSANEKK